MDRRMYHHRDPLSSITYYIRNARAPALNRTCSAHGYDEQTYNNGSTQNDHPIGNLNARYGCFLVKPVHHFSSRLDGLSWRPLPPSCTDRRHLGALRHRPDPETRINFSITWRPSVCASRGLANDSIEDWTAVPLSRMFQRPADRAGTDHELVGRRGRIGHAAQYGAAGGAFPGRLHVKSRPALGSEVC
jgi:hypothetical protein